MDSAEDRKAKFIAKAIAIHGDVYDYSKVEYINKATPVTIVCKKHGDFSKRPSCHIYKNIRQGCPKCAVSKRTMTNEQFLAKAISVHGDKYSYDRAEYKNTTSNVTVTCSVHGDFSVNGYAHITGTGCRKCAANALSMERRRTEEDFLKKAFDKFGDRFEYLSYSHTHITAKCKKHNHVFVQGTRLHLSEKSKGGCKMCKSETLKKVEKSTEDFIFAANKVHNFKYDYSLSEYKGS